MYHSKKIAVFISHIYGDYQAMLIKGISKKAYENGYPLEIYTTNDGEDLGSYGYGDDSIIKIPNFKDIEGVIIASGTYSDATLKEKLFDKLKETGLPVIEVCEKDPVFTHVTLENNLSAGLLTTHMIRVHGKKKISFLGHATERFYSERREEAYKAALMEAGIPFDENSIFLVEENEASYLKALEHFLGQGLPEAIIAYNDRVALGFMEQALKRGIRIPEDLCITGCDCLESGQNITPALTTVSFPLEEVGAAAVKSLIDYINNGHSVNITVTAEPVYRESCGCSKCNPANTFQYLSNRTRKISELEKSMLLSVKMSADLSHATDIDDGCDIIADYVKSLENVREFYMCLYPDWNRIEDSVLEFTDIEPQNDMSDQSVILKLGIRKGKRVPECTFLKTSLLPDFVSADNNLSFLTVPLFFEKKAFGYIAMSFEDGTISFPFKMVQWVMNIAQFLENASQAEHTEVLSRHLEEIYLKDNLTGLYNRHGLNRKISDSEIVSRYITSVLFDMDGLKVINDTYGHEEGDFALKTIGQAILKTLKDTDTAARFGGDEFYALLYHDKEEYPQDFVDEVEGFLNNFNALSGKPYKVTVSAGFETIPYSRSIDFKELLKKADEHMYEIKKAKKQA